MIYLEFGVFQKLFCFVGKMTAKLDFFLLLFVYGMQLSFGNKEQLEITTQFIDPCVHHMKLDDQWRQINNTVIGNHCDNNLERGWYQVLINGQNASLPTVCIKGPACGVQSPLHIEKIVDPDIGEIGSANLCASTLLYSRWECCILSKTIRLKNCGSYYVYELVPRSRCEMGYCSIGNFHDVEQFTAKTGESVGDYPPNHCNPPSHPDCYPIYHRNKHSISTRDLSVPVEDENSQTASVIRQTRSVAKVYTFVVPGSDGYDDVTTNSPFIVPGSDGYDDVTTNSPFIVPGSDGYDDVTTNSSFKLEADAGFISATSAYNHNVAMDSGPQLPASKLKISYFISDFHSYIESKTFPISKLLPSAISVNLQENSIKPSVTNVETFTTNIKISDIEGTSLMTKEKTKYSSFIEYSKTPPGPFSNLSVITSELNSIKSVYPLSQDYDHQTKTMEYQVINSASFSEPKTSFLVNDIGITDVDLSPGKSQYLTLSSMESFLFGDDLQSGIGLKSASDKGSFGISESFYSSESVYSRESFESIPVLFYTENSIHSANIFSRGNLMSSVIMSSGEKLMSSEVLSSIETITNGVVPMADRSLTEVGTFLKVSSNNPFTGYSTWSHPPTTKSLHIQSDGIFSSLPTILTSKRSSLSLQTMQQISTVLNLNQVLPSSVIKDTSYYPEQNLGFAVGVQKASHTLEVLVSSATISNNVSIIIRDGNELDIIRLELFIPVICVGVLTMILVLIGVVYWKRKSLERSWTCRQQEYYTKCEKDALMKPKERTSVYQLEETTQEDNQMIENTSFYLSFEEIERKVANEDNDGLIIPISELPILKTNDQTENTQF